MSEEAPAISIVIAARPGQTEVKAAVTSRGLDYPDDKFEILIARGRQPSAQRNAAIKAARGEWIYFLDDDSTPESENLRRATKHFSPQTVVMVGGPNLCPPDAPPLEQVFALVLASRLAFGPSRARYASFGAPRETSEKELILCNLLARRDALVELGGFNEALYPNEENALMDELQKRGRKLVYDPELIVLRRPRATLGSFARMLLTYGRGRAEQFRLHPTFGSALNFVPPAFCAYLLLFAVALLRFPGLAAWMAWPLALYVIVLLGEGLVLAGTRQGGRSSSQPNPGVGGRCLRALLAIPLVALTHVLYGAGFWRGLFTPLKPSSERVPVEVVLERVKDFSKNLTGRV